MSIHDALIRDGINLIHTIVFGNSTLADSVQIHKNVPLSSTRYAINIAESTCPQIEEYRALRSAKELLKVKYEINAKQF